MFTSAEGEGRDGLVVVVEGPVLLEPPGRGQHHWGSGLILGGPLNLLQIITNAVDIKLDAGQKMFK